MSFRNALFASILSSVAPDAGARPIGPSGLLDAPSIQDRDQLALDALVRDTERLLQRAGVVGVVSARVKEPGSVRAKMRRKNIDYDEVFDRLALRVRVDTVDDCYTVREVLEARHRVIDSERDDYIASPKANGYQSLHSAMQTAFGDIAEFQVRTHEMHRHAETGAAAHWLYKLSA